MIFTGTSSQYFLGKLSRETFSKIFSGKSPYSKQTRPSRPKQLPAFMVITVHIARATGREHNRGVSAVLETQKARILASYAIPSLNNMPTGRLPDARHPTLATSSAPSHMHPKAQAQTPRSLIPKAPLPAYLLPGHSHPPPSPTPTPLTANGIPALTGPLPTPKTNTGKRVMRHDSDPWS